MIIMAILRKKEIRNMSEKGMEKNINEFSLELAKERGNIAIGATVTSPGRIRELRKVIARIKTIKKERLMKSKKDDIQKTAKTGLKNKGG